MKKSYEKLIYTLPQALFAQIDVQKMYKHK